MREAISRIVKFAEKNVLLVTAPSGSGKTRVGMELRKKGINVCELDHIGYTKDAKWLIDVGKVKKFLASDPLLSKGRKVLVGVSDNLLDYAKLVDLTVVLKPDHAVYSMANKLKADESEQAGKHRSWVKHWRERSTLTPDIFHDFFKRWRHDNLSNVKSTLVDVKSVGVPKFGWERT